MATDDNSFGFDDEPSASMSAGEAPGTGVGVVRIAKRDYAVGLHWNGVEHPSKAAAEAREMAASPSFNADLFCLRSGATPQFGLGFKAQGHKAGMPSLAAHLAASRGGSWIGLFEVVGGYYLVAVRDDGILSECDRFFDDGDEARSVFEDFQTQSEWEEAIAPKDFDIPGTRVVAIEGMLEGRPQVRLSEVRRSSNIIRLGLAALAVGVVVIGGMMYLDHQEELRLEEEARAAFEAARNNILGPEEEPIQIPPMPWEGQRMAVPLIEACVEGILKFPTDIPRWRVRELICQNGALVAAVDRDGALGEGGGSINWVKEQVKHLEGALVVPDASGSGSRVAVEWTLPQTPEIPVDIRTAPVAKMKEAMLAQFEERFTPVIFGDADNTEFWLGFTFSFSTTEDPRGFTDVIGALPGAILTSLTYNVDGHVWNLEGKAYEQLPLPQNAVRN